MSYNLKEVITLADKAFSKKSPLTTLHQELADHFYPERADFTITRYIGDEYASHLMTGYPSLVRRELGNGISAMLRPRGKPWFEMTTNRPEKEDNASKQWLEAKTKSQKFHMYKKSSQFSRCTKEADHDFVTFGQAAFTVGMNKDQTGLIFQTWHLKDMAWYENSELVIDQIFRRWKPTGRALMELFGTDALHETVRSKMAVQTFFEVRCMHIVLPSDMYKDADNDYEGKFPYICLHIDRDNEHLMSVTPSHTRKYVLPRWQTVSGSQYAFSPAAITALPDARMIQAMTLILLEAGEKYTSPPMLAVQEAIRSDVALYAGGITWIDPAYDERLGEVLRPLTQDKAGMPIGIDLNQDMRHQISEAFYISKLKLPDTTHDMTAYEVGKRVEEYIRQAMPLFEPMEIEYNGAMCEEVFELLFRNGAFGSPDDIPEAIQGADIEFKFSSPLHEQEGREDTNKFVEAQQILGSAMELEPALRYNVDFHKAFRAAIEGLDAPSNWLHDEDMVREMVAQEKQKMEEQQEMEQAGQVAEIAGQAGQAAEALGGLEGLENLNG